MTTSSPAPRSAVAQAIALLSHYGFDTKPYTAAESVGHWLEDYDSNWIRFAIIEALYQGRYKAVSVEHILSMWSRRGQPSQHFNGDFERIICRKLPAWFSTFALAAEPEVAETEPETTWVAPPPQLPLIVRDDRALQTARQQRRVRCQGIERWRLIAKLGTTTYEDNLIARLKAIATITPTQLQAEISPVIAPEMLMGDELELPQEHHDSSVADEEEAESVVTGESASAAIAPHNSNSNSDNASEQDDLELEPKTVALIAPVVEPELAPVEAQAIVAESVVTPNTVAAAALVLPPSEPGATFATVESDTFYSGIRTFMPSLRVSPFFTRLKDFRVSAKQVILTPALVEPAIAPPETGALAVPETDSTEAEPAADPQPPAAALTVSPTQQETTEDDTLPAPSELATDVAWDDESAIVVRLHS